MASAFLPFSLLLDVRRRFELLRDPALNVSTPFSLLPCEFRARFKGYLRFHLIGGAALQKAEVENDDENDWGSGGSKQKKPHACCSNVDPIDWSL